MILIPKVSISNEKLGEVLQRHCIVQYHIYKLQHLSLSEKRVIGISDYFIHFDASYENITEPNSGIVAIVLHTSLETGSRGVHPL